MTDTAEAELVIVNARIWSPGHTGPRRGAIALGGGRIARIGSNERCEAEAAKDAVILDAGGRLVLPGFVDAHAHMLHTGPRMKWVQLGEISSLPQLLAVVTMEAERLKPGRWLLGRSWDESKWPERRFPTLVELDDSAGSVPVFLRRVDGHMAVVNTAALGRLEIPRNIEGFDVDSDGHPTGAIREKALDIASERLRPSVKDLVESFPLMQEAAHANGITSIHDVVDARGMKAYGILQRRGLLRVRVNLMPLLKLLPNLTKQAGTKDAWLRVGALKAFADGSLGSKTAALYEPYSDSGNELGMLLYRKSVLERIVRHVHRQGFQLAIHAIGDKAIDEVVDAYEKASTGRMIADRRHRIEHFELPTDGALDRCRDLGILPVMQPNFVMEWGLPGGMYESRLGASRVKRNNPFRLVVSKRLRLTFGSDGMPYGPIYGMQGAVCPPYASQRIPVEKALEAYTAGGAFASFEEKIKGSLAVGMLADLVVIEGSWSGRGLRSWRVAATIVDGKVVHRTPAIKRA